MWKVREIRYCNDMKLYDHERIVLFIRYVVVEFGGLLEFATFECHADNDMCQTLYCILHCILHLQNIVIKVIFLNVLYVYERI